MKAPNPPTDNWRPCEDGTLAEVQLVSQADPVRRNLLKGAAVFTGLAGIVGFRLLFDQATKQSRNTTIIPTQCEVVLANLDQYIAEDMEDRALTRIMDAHLLKCSYCQSQYKKHSIVSSIVVPPPPKVPRAGKGRGCGSGRNKTKVKKQLGQLPSGRLRRNSQKPIPAAGIESV